jgi:nicotinamide-nucleotide adenylyltransferase
MGDSVLPVVDVGVTKLPYFHEKAATITASGMYAPTTEQVYLTGYDTLVRLLDPKYYPPKHRLDTLEPFMSRNRIRVTYRADASWGSKAEQEEYLANLAQGEREHEGGRREWADRIDLVEGRLDGEEIISSTKVREAARRGDQEALKKLVTDGVAEWVVAEGLYRDDAK